MVVLLVSITNKVYEIDCFYIFRYQSNLAVTVNLQGITEKTMGKAL